MKAIRDRCPRCKAEIVRFPSQEKRIISCPACRSALETSEQGLRRVVGRAAAVVPAGSVGDAKDGHVSGKGGEPVAMPVLPGAFRPRRWFWPVLVPVLGLGVAVVGVYLIGFPGTSPALPELSSSNAAPAIPVAAPAKDFTELSSTPDGPRRPATELDKSSAPNERAPKPLPRPPAASPADAGEPIPASLVDVVRAVAPAVATIFVKETDGEGLGSGFLVHSSRLMVTNYHVIARAAHAVAVQRRPDGSAGITRVVKGFVACEPRSDLVLLALAEEWPGTPLTLSPSKSAVGQSVFAVGSPHGLIGTVTRGIVCGLRKAGELEHDRLSPGVSLVQTDAFFSQGSSGGPLCDEQGRVVGVTAFGCSFADDDKAVRDDVFRFAIAVDEIRQLIASRTTTVKPLSQLPRSP